MARIPTQYDWIYNLYVKEHIKETKKNVMKVKVKKLDPKAIVPKYAKPGDAGMDLTATSRMVDDDSNIVYGTGLAVEIPEGYVGLIFPRSSNAKKDLYLTNHVGVIDSGYRGEIMFKFRKSDYSKNFKESKIYEIGERVGQLMIIPYPQVVFEEVEELTLTERGIGGFGSSGN
jgi:dUTP pyrophosphatase